MAVVDAGVWPLVGRDDELQAIEAAIAAGEPGGVVLVGAAGTGKTRLLRETVARHAGAGGEWEWVVATRAVGSIPFGAVSRLLPPDLTRDPNPLALLAAVAREFAARSANGPVLVGVDDAHLLDDASAGLLHQLAIQRLVVPLMVVRDGEPVSDALLTLWKEHAVRQPVRPLSRTAVDELLAHALPGQIDPITRRRLHRLTDGNPLLLRELLADVRESGALRRYRGVWCWRGSVVGGTRLAELVRARLQALDPGTRQALETIACGEPVPLAILERLVERRFIEAAERSGLVVVQRSGARTALRLAHPLYGEVLRANLPASSARTIWRQLAEVLVSGPMRRHDDPLFAGVWELRSGTIKHPELLLAAAQRAIGRFDLDLAERLARAARATAPGWAADRLLAQILHDRARSQEALEVLPEAPPPESGQWASWAVTRAHILAWGLDRPAEAEELLRTRPGPLTEATRSWILFCGGRTREARQVAEAVLRSKDLGKGARIWAAMTSTAAAGMLGAPDIGVDPLNLGRCHALRAAGRLHEAREVADEGHRAAVASNATARAAMWAGFQGTIAKAQGRLADAKLALREAVALLDEADPYQIAGLCLAELAGVAALAGDVAEARRWMSGARSVNRLYRPWIELDRAWVEAAGGAVSSAIELARSAAGLARDAEQPTFEVLALYDVARLGSPGMVRARLDRLAGQLGGGFAPALAAAAAGLATDDGPTLADAADRLAEHGHTMLAAEAAAASARAFRRAGLAVRTRVALERAAALAGACRAVRTPLLDSNDLGAVLTSREREIAMLAVNLPSREIAERLGLSVRTVNNTLARAFTKLGVSRRREFAALLGSGQRAPSLSK